MDGNWVDLLRDVYGGNTMILRMGAVESDVYRVDQGLRQGCPMSCMLFLLYIENVARSVHNSGLGFCLQGGHETVRIPLLLFADDMVLLGTSASEVQTLLDICGETTEERGLLFNEKKSAILYFSGSKDNFDCKIQDKLLPVKEEYRYLGVVVTARRDFLKEEQNIRLKKGTRGSAVVRGKALWTFNRFIVARNVWKAVFVPALTYANAVLVLGGDVEKKLEVMQRDVVRFALGCRFTFSKEFLQGEGDMSSFWFREAQAKLVFWTRLERLSDDRWVAKFHKIKKLLSVKTKWDRRVEFSARLLGYNKREWEGAGLGVQEVKGMIREQQVKDWTESMRDRSSLVVYRSKKVEWGGVEGLYDNSRGSALLADARAVMLDTNVHRSHFEEVGTLCAFCGQEDETVEHVVIGCSSLALREVELVVALGLGDAVMWDEVRETKKRLACWKRRKEEDTGVI